MKKFFALGFFVAFVFCPAYAWAQPQPKSPLPIQAPHLSARIELGTRKSEFSGGDNVVLDITLENSGDTPLRFRWDDVDRFYQIEVMRDGKAVQPLPAFKPKSRIRINSGGFQILPQQSKKGYIRLNWAFDLSQVGTYTVTVSKKIIQDKGSLDVTSGPFSFKMKEPPAFSYWDTDIWDTSVVPAA